MGLEVPPIYLWHWECGPCSSAKWKEKKCAVDVTAMALSSLQKPTYAERLFADLWKIHKEDHCKGTTFFYRVRDTHGNVTREVCKLFTDVCPHCIVVQSRKKPTAGIHPIITKWLGVCGQVNLITFKVCLMVYLITSSTILIRSEEVDIDSTSV